MTANLELCLALVPFKDRRDAPQYYIISPETLLSVYLISILFPEKKIEGNLPSLIYLIYPICAMWRIRQSHFSYPVLLFALVTIVLQDNSICFSSFSVVLRQVVLDLPLFLLPSAVQKMASLVMC
jgi:hypothetical protein